MVLGGRMRLNIVVDEDLYGKLNEAKAKLMVERKGRITWAEVLEAVLEQYLKMTEADIKFV
jgi:hypothetical protein